MSPFASLGMTIPWVIVFFVSAGVIVYSYAIYPLLLALVPVRRREELNEPSEWPSVSVLISVYNEEKHITQRIENLLALHYPADKFEVLIGSDGSIDRTNELVRRFGDPRVQLHEFG